MSYLYDSIHNYYFPSKNWEKDSIVWFSWLGNLALVIEHGSPEGQYLETSGSKCRENSEESWFILGVHIFDIVCK